MKKWRGWLDRCQRRLGYVQDGLRYAFGSGFWYCTHCPDCERDIDIEVRRPR